VIDGGGKAVHIAVSCHAVAVWVEFAAMDGCQKIAMPSEFYYVSGLFQLFATWQIGQILQAKQSQEAIGR
jgi:hypothetical protein